MRKADEAPGKIVGRLPHAVVDQSADFKVGLIEAGAAGQDAGIDAGAIHHPHVRGEVRQQRIEQITRIAVLIEQDRDRVAIALQEFWRRVMLLEIDDHSNAPSHASCRGTVVPSAENHGGCSRADISASQR